MTKCITILFLNRVAVLFLLLIGSVIFVCAQQKQVLQIKTLNEQLQPFAFAEVSLDGAPYINTGNKGSVITEIAASALPVKNIDVKDQQFEVDSWSMAKGVLQIVLRKKRYKEVRLAVKFEDGKPVPQQRVYFSGATDVQITTDQQGRAVFPIPLQEEVKATGQFKVPPYVVSQLTAVNGEQTLFVRSEVVASATPAQEPVAKAEEKFNLSQLDSIQSLTVFYAVMRNKDFTKLSAQELVRVDAKFKELEEQHRKAEGREPEMFVGNISDSSFVAEDIRNLIRQATQEREALGFNRESFDEKIKLITEKLEQGFTNLGPVERAGLLKDLDMLEKLLIENESKFFKNQEDYRVLINSLKEKYFDIENLETQLIEAESTRLEEQRQFRQRLFLVLGLLAAFGVMIVLLISFSGRLRRQARALKAANEEVRAINDNLEKIVEKRTLMLAQTNRELDTFLYRSAHDMRAPLRSILGLCSLAGHIPQEDLLSKVVQATTNLDAVLKRLISISDIGKDKTLKIYTKAELEELVRIQFGATLRQRNIELTFTMDENLTFTAMPALEEHILVPMLENAVLYSTLRENGKPAIELSIEKQKGMLEIMVHDNGIGIDDKTKARVFEMFYRGHTSAQGAGLGLYLVNKSVAAMGGSVAVESEPGQYARFTVKLPNA
ncbi:MAG: hypothetical protein KF803_13540 [Cyclobacteriaceae bacterium]|nr:hypothetical protein [Cyclobacteriaceae bacterium]